MGEERNKKYRAFIQLIERMLDNPERIIENKYFKLYIQYHHWVFTNLRTGKLTIFHKDKLYLIYDRIEYEQMKKEAQYEVR